VLEAGRHEELLAKDGAYAALWRVQTGEAVAPRDHRSA
jgi:ATP-binding cassette subfamily B protein